jgi:hypothetical protein
MFYFIFILMLVIPNDIEAVDVKTYIPKNAIPLLETLYKEQQRLFKEHPYVEYFPALIEQESCISLTHSRCWSAKSTLNTKRELGVGFFQITKAFNSNGSIRFDVLNELKRAYKSELSDLTWGNIANSPNLQIRAGLLKVKDTWKNLYNVKDPRNRAIMTDAAYNGGLGHVNRERRVCGLQKNCNPQIWFGNVEMIRSVKSQRPLYGKRSAWDINREHPRSVFNIRMPKYLKYYKSQTWFKNIGMSNVNDHAVESISSGDVKPEEMNQPSNNAISIPCDCKCNN